MIESRAEEKNIIIGISGASGSIYGVRIIEKLKTLPNVKTHLVITKSAHITLDLETDYKLREIIDLADFHYNINDIASLIASGSFITNGMIIAPCSVKTLAAIATGNCTNLLTRAADVILKERRSLVLMLRETPFNLIHIDNMQKATLAGAIIMPPVPAFYTKPQSIDDIINYSVARALDLLSIHDGGIKRWVGVDSNK
ncbi:MAG: UbiX family flavin prenyltransferase [Rickettsiales bacterium]|jgi:flavin prenyltransferase|nr:UbiX family flavin prenyltransferase [Rickettsiales bacterium]